MDREKLNKLRIAFAEAEPGSAEERMTKEALLEFYEANNEQRKMAEAE